MNDFPQKINNSYESGSNSSSTASSGACFEETEAHRIVDGVAGLMEGAELYNTSAEEGIFPNVFNYQPQVPSYSRQYDDYVVNEYSNAPIVYSWLPIVAGFNEDGVENLQNFKHIAGKLHNLNDSSGSDESAEISNQNEKYSEHLVVNEAKLLNNHAGMEFQELENSCNAMDLNISVTDGAAVDPDLSFNGKITGLNIKQECEERAVHVLEMEEQQRLYNESFELLSKEDSSKMLYINEKSPEPSFEDEIPSDNEPALEVSSRPLEFCDSSVLKKLRMSLAGLHPPPSITSHQMSLTEMLTEYNKNVNHDPPAESAVQSSSFFIPSHSPAEVVNMEWPGLASVKCLDVAYNKSTDCEQIEELCMRYSQRFVGAETTSSFNYKISASSAKKKIERLKLSTQSPGRRLSHLANRRKIFSSANLKLSAQAPSQSTTGSRLLIDRKLLARAKSPKKRTSAKKKTPKRKTPKSAKRLDFVSKPEPSRVSSKRALFTSPLQATQSMSSLVVTKPEVPERGRLPRRSLFSPDDQKKRKRSPDQDAENRCGKQPRMFSPTRMPKSQSFSVAPSTSTEHFKKRLFERTQSEVVVTESSVKKKSLGLTQPMTEDQKKKLLWSVSNALSEKNIKSNHEKFKQCAKNLSKLVMKIFTEFYDPSNKSVSAQMKNFANQMVFYVIQGQDLSTIYLRTRNNLMSKNATKLSGYLSQKDYELNKQNLVLKNNSLLMLSHSCSSLNFSQQSDSSFNGSSLNLSQSNSSLNRSSSSLNRSSSKSNDLSALRENFMNSGEKPARKFGGSDSNLNKQPSSASSASSLLKAKRQISF